MYSIHAQQKEKSPGGATPWDFFLDFTKSAVKCKRKCIDTIGGVNLLTIQPLQNDRSER